MFMTNFMVIFVFICILLSACNNGIQENSSNVEEALKGKDVAEIEGNEWKISEVNPKIVDGKVPLRWSSDYKDNKAYSYEVLFSADGEFGDISSFKTDTARGHLRCDADERGICPGIVYVKVGSQQVMQFEHDFESTITEMINSIKSNESDDVLEINYLRDSRYKILACTDKQCISSEAFGLNNDIEVAFYPMHLKFDGLHKSNFIKYEVQIGNNFIPLKQYDDKTTATVDDTTWLLPFISTGGELTIQACLGSNDDNCQEYTSVQTEDSTKRYITAFDDRSVLENASGAYKGSELLAVYDRDKNKISFLAADQNCNKDNAKTCPDDISERNESYLHWSVLNSLEDKFPPNEVYSLAIANKKIFVGLANSNKVQVYGIDVQYANGNYTVDLPHLSDIIPKDFSQFGFSLAVVGGGQHLVVGSPADNKIAIYNIKNDGTVSVDNGPESHSSYGSFGFSVAATGSGFYVGTPFANKITPYTLTASEQFTSGSIIQQTEGEEATYYGYSIASANNSVYVTDPEQDDVLNQGGKKSSFAARISQQHNSILTVCDIGNTDKMNCEVKVKEDVANKIGYADFITASSMKGKDIFVVDTQDKLYISHDLTNESYLVEEGLLKTVTCNPGCEATAYRGEEPIAFEDMHGTDEDGKVYNYSNILFGLKDEATGEVLSNLYTGGFTDYNGTLYNKHLLAFNAQGRYKDYTYYGHNTDETVTQASYYIHENKLYVSKAGTYTNRRFTWDDTTNKFLFCSSTENGVTQCQTSKSGDYTNSYVATGGEIHGKQYFLYNDGNSDKIYKVINDTNIVVEYNDYIICYDGEANDTQNRQSVYACQLSLPTNIDLATNTDWPKYEIYGNHTLYYKGEKASNMHWCGGENDEFRCNTAGGDYGEHGSQEGDMQFTDGKQTSSGLQELFNRAIVNGRWYNGEKDKHSSYTGRGRDGDDEEWENGYCKDGYHDSHWFFGWNNQCKLVERSFNEKND